MNHITDFQLNEYLDHALDEATQGQCDLHLSSCAECHARLEELKGLYSNLAELREVELSRDLTSSVLAHLPRVWSNLWTPAFAAQLGAALGMALFIAVEISQSIRIPPLPTSQISLPELRFRDSQLPILYPQIPISYFPLTIFNFPFIIPDA